MKKTKTGYIGDKVVTRPKQYQIGIDTFTRAIETMSTERIIGFCQGNIDKYIWREKGSDIDDLYKARDYIELWISILQRDSK
jgi:hypothetical protein